MMLLSLRRRSFLLMDFNFYFSSLDFTPFQFCEIELYKTAALRSQQLTLCILGNFVCVLFICLLFSKSTFSNNSFRTTLKVSNNYQIFPHNQNHFIDIYLH